MTSELIVDVQANEVSIAILEDKKLVELQKEGIDASFAVGNIYAAKVKKLAPGMNAAFVDIGYKKDAFLHYSDLGPNFNSFNKFYQLVLDQKTISHPSVNSIKSVPSISKEGFISDILKQGQVILVQIVKEPISTKGPRISTEISLAGRHLVLIPFSNKVSISQKIKSKEERERLKQLILSIKPKNFGVIVRTVAEGKKVIELDSELKALLQRWEDCIPKLSNTKLPILIHEEKSRVVGLLRDIFNPSFQSIYVNDKNVYQQIVEYISFIAPEKKSIIKLYEGELTIFDNFGVTKQIKSLFGKTVTFRHGAYLIIEHTEALHVIDVNSGTRTKNPQGGQEVNAWEVNSAAAEEIARQMRLRDLGGIIVIDFIDMTSGENRVKLMKKMQDLMETDRAKHNILPLSKFGLLQITRQRVRPEMEISTSEACPTCSGKETIRPSILFTDTLRMKLSYIYNNLKIKKITLKVHPFIYAYINQGFPSLKWKWKWRYSFNFKIIPDQQLELLEYRFYDENGEELEMKQDFEIN